MEQILNLNEESKEELSEICSHDFDIFKLRQSTKENELVTVVCHILAREGIFDKLPIANEKFLMFIQKIQSTYNDITYHNKTHGADLAQSFYYMVTSGELRKKCELTNWEVMSYIVAAACHDVGHMGFNNVYHMEKRDSIGMRYNDNSVLENFHIATTFEILSFEKYNIFSELSKDEYKKVRKLMIGAILATDMSFHFTKFSILKGKLESKDLNPTNIDEKKFFCEQLFHMCDISNAAKPFNICEKWTNLLFVEFFQQGDMEKTLGHDVS